MKLWYSPASPFVRKVLVVAHETGLEDRITILEASTNAVNRNLDLVKDNPSGKIPALVLDDGSTIFDSRVICAYLDTLHGEAKLSVEGPGKFADMTMEALGDALMDAAVLARYEAALRPPENRWDKWEEGQMAKVISSLDMLEAKASTLKTGRPTMGGISIAAALGYLDYRFGTMNWREGRPKLTAWSEQVNARPSLRNTQPHP
ncbi:MAG: glutathione S-transferase [Rhizobiaceae bacterium]